MDWAHTFLTNVQGSFAVKFLLSPLYVVPSLAIAALVWFFRGRPDGLLRFLFPKELYLHPSTLVDIKVALFNILVFGVGAISALFVVPYVTITVLEQMTALAGGRLVVDTSWLRGAVACVLLILTQDFCRYWNHYLHHENRFLWPFHAVHHSAEVMTPITFLRAHPVYSALQALLISALVGLMQAFVLFALVGQIEAWVIWTGTLVFNAYVFFGGHLRHSHIWLSYGRRMEHILISPAQHQIHHSSDPRHHDMNYGEIFAIWDWMFGTLYVPDGQEDLTFGIADSDGVRIEQPHVGLWSAMTGPFVDTWEEILKGTSRAPSLPPETERKS